MTDKPLQENENRTFSVPVEERFGVPERAAIARCRE